MKLLEIFIIATLLFFTLVFDNIAPQEQKFKAICDRCNGKCNEEFCKINVSCRPVNRTSKWRTVDIVFKEGIALAAPVIVDMIAYKKFRTVYRPLMIKIQTEFCQQILERNHPVLKLFGENMLNDGSMFEPCPLKGHRYVTPRASSTNVHVLIPSGEWKVEFTFSKYFNDTKTHIFTVYFYYTVKATTAEEF